MFQKNLKKIIALVASVALLMQIPLAFAAVPRVEVTQKNIGGLNIAIGSYNAQVGEFTVKSEVESKLLHVRVLCLDASGIDRMRLKYNGDTISSVVPEAPSTGNLDGLEAYFLPDFDMEADTDYKLTVHANISSSSDTYATSCAIVEVDDIKFKDIDENNIASAYVDGNFGISNGTYPIYIEPKEVVEEKAAMNTGSVGQNSSGVTFDPQPEDVKETEAAAEATVSKVQQDLPEAKFEDEVLTAFEAYKKPFPDTSLNTLVGRAAAELYRRGVINGYEDGEFKKDNDVNRAELAKFLLETKLESISPLSNNNQFSDVLGEPWFLPYVMISAFENIISGYPDGTFKPAKTVNTAEFLKMLTLTFGLDEDLPHTYTDFAKDVWFNKYAGVAIKYELFPDRTNTKLQPGKNMTRGEVAVALYRYLANR